MTILRTKHSNKHRLLKTLIVLLIAIYIAGYLYFSNYYYPKTLLDGKDVSLTKRNSAISRLSKNDLDTIKLKSSFGEEDSISKNQIGYKKEFVSDKSVDNDFLWFLKAFSNKEKIITSKTIFDKSQLDKIASSSIFIKDKREPKDAQVIVENKEVVIIDEIDDNLVDKEYLKAEIIKAFDSNSKEVKIDKFIKPKITSKSEEILAKKDELEKFLNKSIKITAHDNNYTITVKDVYDGQTFDKDKIKAFVDEIANSSDTINRRRKFTTYDNHQITLEKGTYGYRIARNKTTDKLYEAFTNNNFEDIKPSYASVGYKGSDIGNTYIEVDLSKQRLYFIKNKKLVKESPLVSGQIPGAYTLTGVNSIKAKVPNRYLIGKNRITKKKYKSLVKYWMPIDYSGIGLHDASWQGGNFSPTKYLSGYGSNGCINLPESTAAYLFNNADIGTPVLVYETTTKHSKPHY